MAPVAFLAMLKRRGFMKKARKIAADELRPEYKPSDFKTLVRGKYAAQLRASSTVSSKNYNEAGQIDGNERRRINSDRFRTRG